MQNQGSGTAGSGCLKLVSSALRGEKSLAVIE